MVLLVNSAVLILGLVLIILSSDYLIKVSVKLAYLLRLTTLFIGLILIAFGTSLPEAAVSITAVIEKHKDIALGNIVGSNIANLGLVLGVSGLLMPLKIDRSLLKRELPIMLGSALFLYVCCLDLVISRFEGAVMLAGFIIFCALSYKHSSSKDLPGETGEKQILPSVKSKTAVFALFIVSLSLLVLGANLMVNSGVKIAEFFKVKPWIIAVTVFAIGTSLPELSASISAAVKKISSISIGNIIGSNIFNILLVIGSASLLRPISLERHVLKFELPLLIVFSLVVALLMWVKKRISRIDAGILFIGYVSFIILLVRGM